MIGPEFASVFLKLGRAEEHFETIKAEILAWKHRDPYIITRKCDAQGYRHSLVVDLKGTPPIDRLAVVTGDCAHNLRSALDNIVYAVAVRESGCNPPPQHDRLQFPIASSPDGFGKQAWRIASLSEMARAKIRAVQPYNRPHSHLPPLLQMLADFNNADKHRLLNVVVANAQQGKFGFTPPNDMLIFVPPTVGYNTGAIESGTEFAWFTVTPPQPNVRYDYEATFAISIAHAAGPSGRTMGELVFVLEVIIAEVKRIIDSMVF